jgi:hypothetical protein
VGTASGKKVVRRQLCAGVVISDARTASAFLNGHWAVPGSSQLPLSKQQHGPLQIVGFLEAVPRKKLSDIVNFLKSLEFWRNIYEMMQLKMHCF